MSRRKRNAPTMIDWHPDFAEAFVVPANWKPPARVKVWAAKAHFTVTGIFTTPGGQGCNALIRLRPAQQGGLYLARKLVEQAELRESV